MQFDRNALGKTYLFWLTDFVTIWCSDAVPWGLGAGQVEFGSVPKYGNNTNTNVMGRLNP